MPDLQAYNSATSEVHLQALYEASYAFCSSSPLKPLVSLRKMSECSQEAHDCVQITNVK